MTDREARALLSSRHMGDLAGLVYLYLDPETARAGTCRLRRDHPEIENGKPKDKYLSAYGDNRHLFFQPGAGALLADTSAPVVIVESEKAVLACAAAAERAGGGGCS